MNTYSKNNNLFYLLLYALLVIVSRIPSLKLILDTDSSANAFLARQMLRGETLYDKFHTAHHLPAIYYTFAAAFKLFGDRPMAPRLLMIAFIFAGTWLIFLFGRTFFNHFVGVLAAFFYILGTSQYYLAGNTVEMEHFANAFMIAIPFMFFVLLKKNAPAWQFIWIGVLSAICILYKVIFIGSLIAIGFALLFSTWMERGQVGYWKKLLSRLIAISIGLTIPLALTAIYFAQLGLWDRFLLVFQLGFNYTNDQSLIIPFPKPFGFPLFMLAMTNIALLIFGLFGAYRTTRNAFPLRTLSNLTNLTLALWFLFTLILAGFRGGGYQHYVLVVIPPLALSAALEISALRTNWSSIYSEKQAITTVGVIIALILINYIWRNNEVYRIYLPFLPGNSPTLLEKQARDMEMFEYIKSHTTPEDFIYVWSINVQAYYYADREPPIDILWPSYVSATGPAERIFNSNTKYIIVDNPEIFERPEWLLSGLHKYYHLETTINGMDFYLRNKK